MWLVVKTSGASLITGLVFYGIALVAAQPLIMLIMMDMPEVGSKYMGAATGMFFCIGEIGGFSGPFIVGAIRDLTGGFVTGTGIFAVVSLLIAFMALFLKPQPLPAAEPSAPVSNQA